MVMVMMTTTMGGTLNRTLEQPTTDIQSRDLRPEVEHPTTWLRGAHRDEKKDMPPCRGALVASVNNLI